MSNRYKGGVISATPPTLVAGAGASGTWTLEQQMQANAAGLWPVNGPFYIEDVFSTYLYTGNGTSQTITNGIDLSTKGGLVWTKSRAGTYTFSHRLVDTVRGSNNGLRSNGTFANQVLTDAVTGFTSTGYTLGSDQTEGNVNYSSAITYVSWTFREQPKFFDVVTFSGTGSAQTIAHNLGSVPGCIIVKNLDALTSWAVYHRSLGGTYITRLNTDGASETGYENWANTDPTSTVFTVGNGNATNGSGYNYVAYVFAHNAGGFGLTGTDNVISCGSFTTDGSGNATVTLGYEPQWMLLKQSNGTNSWGIYDTMRGWNYSNQNYLIPNASSAEGVINAANFAPNATGFTTSSPVASSATYIYIAIRRGPMRTPTTGTSVFLPTSRTGNATLTTVTSGFAPDVVIGRRVDTLDNGNESVFADKLRGSGTISTNNTAAEYAGGATTGLNSYTNTGVVIGVNNSPIYAFNYSGLPYALYQLQRAPGFMDEVCYSGAGGSGQTIAHNLGVAPELLIFKKRNSTGNWTVVMPAIGGNPVSLNLNDYSGSSNIAFVSSFGASSITTASGYDTISESGSTYVAYFFATCPGVSKVGNYAGTGAALTVDCGFTSGARFVMIKRLDGTNIYRGWYVWDSARGITSGSDPYFLFNETAAQTTGTNYVDSASSGFTLTTDSAGASGGALNASGGTYIFLAIA